MKYSVREIHDGWIFRRGDIYLANLNPRRGSVQGGTRPVVVLPNNDGNTDLHESERAEEIGKHSHDGRQRQLQF